MMSASNSSNISKILAQKQAESIAKIKEAAATPSNPILGKVETGMSSSVGFASTSPVPNISAQVAAISEERAAASLGVYKPIRLMKFAKARGSLVYPYNGYYYAMDEEEVDMLEVYRQRGLVERVESKLAEDKKED